MAAPLTDHLHAVCRAVLDALSRAVPGEVLACDLVQVDRRDFPFQTVAAAHFPGGPVRRLVLGCEQRLVDHFAATLGGDGLGAFGDSVRGALADGGLPWAADQEFLVHDADRFRVRCEGVRNFLLRVAVAEGRLDLVIDLAPRAVGASWLRDELAGATRVRVGRADEAVGDPAMVRRIMGHLADGEADVEVRLDDQSAGADVRQGTFLSRAYRPDGERLVLTCARHDALDEGVAAPDEVTLVFVLQDRLLQCACPVLEMDRTWLDDDLYLQTLMLAYPDEVVCGQRRGAFRMAPPERLRGRVCRDTAGDVATGACANVRVEDLSLTGARLQLDGSAILSGFKGGARVRCTLLLPPGYGEVSVGASVRRLHVVRDDPTERGAMVGVEFTGDDEDAADLATLRRYVEDRCADRLAHGSVDLQIG
jgi:hypothetical protein